LIDRENRLKAPAKRLAKGPGSNMAPHDAAQVSVLLTFYTNKRCRV
jgi:hypothetical protein